MLVTELKSEALKERHWKQLMRNLRVAWQLHDLTLGQVWAVDLQRNEGIVKDVILVAQGEMALEEFLKMVSLCACICLQYSMRSWIICTLVHMHVLLVINALVKVWYRPISSLYFGLGMIFRFLSYQRPGARVLDDL